VNPICWSNTKTFDDSDVIILGVPDETHSHSIRKGTKEAPQRIREISNLRDIYSRNGVKSLGLPNQNIKRKVFDYGNISRQEIPSIYHKILQSSKFPILIGGDHSITKLIIESMYNDMGKISLMYFDAHPDFISSTNDYYGSVFYDVLPYIDTNSSVQIGIRTPEKEELENLIKYGVEIITPKDLLIKGVREVTEYILQKVSHTTYISIDMDCIDPAFAPGVSVPVPLGLGSLEVSYITNKIIQNGCIGLDIMEVCPEYDIKDRTSHLASRLIGEAISSLTDRIG